MHLISHTATEMPFTDDFSIVFSSVNRVTSPDDLAAHQVNNDNGRTSFSVTDAQEDFSYVSEDLKMVSVHNGDIYLRDVPLLLLMRFSKTFRKSPFNASDAKPAWQAPKSRRDSHRVFSDLGNQSLWSRISSQRLGRPSDFSTRISEPVIVSSQRALTLMKERRRILCHCGLSKDQSRMPPSSDPHFMSTLSPPSRSCFHIKKESLDRPMDHVLRSLLNYMYKIAPVSGYANLPSWPVENLRTLTTEELLASHQAAQALGFRPFPSLIKWELLHRLSALHLRAPHISEPRVSERWIMASIRWQQELSEQCELAAYDPYAISATILPVVTHAPTNPSHATTSTNCIASYSSCDVHPRVTPSLFEHIVKWTAENDSVFRRTINGILDRVEADEYLPEEVGQMEAVLFRPGYEKPLNRAREVQSNRFKMYRSRCTIWT